MIMSILVMFPVVYVQEFLLGIYLEVELLKIQLHEIPPNCFSKVVVSICTPPAVSEKSWGSTSSGILTHGMLSSSQNE